MERKTYKLTPVQYERILRASRSVPAMFLSGGQPMFGTPQENANTVWQGIAQEHNCKWDTIERSPKGEDYFTAIPLGEHNALQKPAE
jgi:hypothetical protein